MPTITLLIGISGSGKSTYAQAVAPQTNSIIVSRDKLREMIFGYTEETIHKYYGQKENLYKNEQLITTYQNSLIKKALERGQNVIVDNTNLVLKHIKDFHKTFHHYENHHHLIECDLSDAIKRDKLRVRSVGESVIKDQYQKLQNLKQNFDFKSYIPVTPNIKNDPSKPDCVVFDIDGTLALKGNRNAYDWKRVGEDTVNASVYALYRSLVEDVQLNNYKIIICSGRSEVCRNETYEWLHENDMLTELLRGTYESDLDFKHTTLYMRKENDNRPDWIVKQEMWEQICKDYYIEFMVDDRNQVVEHARKLGFTVFQVADGDF